MRTLVLLAALFLLALLAQAEPIPEKAEDITEEHSEDEDDYQKAFSHEEAESSEEAGTQAHSPGSPQLPGQSSLLLSTEPGQGPQLQDPELAQQNNLVKSVIKTAIKILPKVWPQPPRTVIVLNRKRAQYPGEQDQQGI